MSDENEKKSEGIFQRDSVPASQGEVSEGIEKARWKEMDYKIPLDITGAVKGDDLTFLFVDGKMVGVGNAEDTDAYNAVVGKDKVDSGFELKPDPNLPPTYVTGQIVYPCGKVEILDSTTWMCGSDCKKDDAGKCTVPPEPPFDNTVHKKTCEDGGDGDSGDDGNYYVPFVVLAISIFVLGIALFIGVCVASKDKQSTNPAVMQCCGGESGVCQCSPCKCSDGPKGKCCGGATGVCGCKECKCSKDKCCDGKKPVIVGDAAPAAEPVKEGHKLFAKILRNRVAARLQKDGFASVGGNPKPLDEFAAWKLVNKLEDKEIVAAGVQTGSVGENGSLLDSLGGVLKWIEAHKTEIVAILKILLTLLAVFG